MAIVCTYLFAFFLVRGANCNLIPLHAERMVRVAPEIEVRSKLFPVLASEALLSE